MLRTVTGLDGGVGGGGGNASVCDRVGKSSFANRLTRDGGAADGDAGGEGDPDDAEDGEPDVEGEGIEVDDAAAPDGDAVEAEALNAVAFAARGASAFDGDAPGDVVDVDARLSLATGPPAFATAGAAGEDDVAAAAEDCCPGPAVCADDAAGVDDASRVPARAADGGDTAGPVDAAGAFAAADEAVPFCRAAAPLPAAPCLASDDVALSFDPAGRFDVFDTAPDGAGTSPAAAAVSAAADPEGGRAPRAAFA